MSFGFIGSAIKAKSFVAEYVVLGANFGDSQSGPIVEDVTPKRRVRSQVNYRKTGPVTYVSRFCSSGYHYGATAAALYLC